MTIRLPARLSGLTRRAIRPAVYGWFVAVPKPLARFNGLTAIGFSHAVADGSSRGEKDAKAPSVTSTRRRTSPKRAGLIALRASPLKRAEDYQSPCHQSLCHKRGCF